MHGLTRAGAVLCVLGLLGALCVAAATSSGVAAVPSLDAGEVLELPVGGVGGVPANAAAAALNFTVTNPSAVGYVTVYPCGAPRPVASNLNFVAGETIPNLVLAKLGTSGRVCVYTNVATDVIVDLSGYFPAGSGYTPIENPTRILDTRSPVQRLGAGAVLELPVGGVGGVPANAAAAALNFTVANSAGVGYVTVYPCGAPRPVALNLNFVAGQAIPNLVLAKLGTSGRVCVYTNVATDVIVDVSGYFPAGSGYTPIENPTRILDTRSPVQRLGAGAVLELPVGGVGGVPANAAAAALNFTVANSAGVGYVTVYPCGAPRPVASNLNFVAGQAIPNLVLAKLGTSGRVCVYTNVATDVIVDVSGYFPAGSGYTPIENPTRILDTRSPCGIVDPAFCETFDVPRNGGTQTGDLDPVIWGVSRIGNLNPSQGAVNSIPTPHNFCAGGAATPVPGDVRICNGQMVETVNDGDGVVSLDTYPKQPFNFAGRTGKVTFDVSADSGGNHAAWPEFVITDEPVPGTRQSIGGEQLHARNEIGFSLAGCGLGGSALTGVSLIFASRNGVYQGPGAFEGVPMTTVNCITRGSRTAMNHFEVRLSTSRIEVWGTDAGSTTLKLLVFADNLNLQFSQGLVWLNDSHYNAHKGCEPCGPGLTLQTDHNFFWDNLGFDGPKTYRDWGFDVPLPNTAGALDARGGPTVNTGFVVGTTGARTLTIPGVNKGVATSAKVVVNTSTWDDSTLTVSVNGRPPVSHPMGGFEVNSFSFPIPLGDIVNGTNTLTFTTTGGNTIIANVTIIMVAAAPVP